MYEVGLDSSVAVQWKGKKMRTVIFLFLALHTVYSFAEHESWEDIYIKIQDTGKINIYTNDLVNPYYISAGKSTDYPYRLFCFVIRQAHISGLGYLTTYDYNIDRDDRKQFLYLFPETLNTDSYPKLIGQLQIEDTFLHQIRFSKAHAPYVLIGGITEEGRKLSQGAIDDSGGDPSVRKQRAVLLRVNTETNEIETLYLSDRYNDYQDVQAKFNLYIEPIEQEVFKLSVNAHHKFRDKNGIMQDFVTEKTKMLNVPWMN